MFLPTICVSQSHSKKSHSKGRPLANPKGSRPKISRRKSRLVLLDVQLVQLAKWQLHKSPNGARIEALQPDTFGLQSAQAAQMAPSWPQRLRPPTRPEVVGQSGAFRPEASSSKEEIDRPKRVGLGGNLGHLRNLPAGKVGHSRAIWLGRMQLRAGPQRCARRAIWRLATQQAEAWLSRLRTARRAAPQDERQTSARRRLLVCPAPRESIKGGPHEEFAPKLAKVGAGRGG